MRGGFSQVRQPPQSTLLRHRRESPEAVFQLGALSVGRQVGELDRPLGGIERLLPVVVGMKPALEQAGEKAGPPATPARPSPPAAPPSRAAKRPNHRPHSP